MLRGFRERLILFLLVVVSAVLLLVPTVFRDQIGKSWPFGRPLALGLDLSGGVHLVYEVLTQEAAKGALQGTANDARRILREQKVAVMKAQAVSDVRFELILLSDSLADKARDALQDRLKTFTFIEKAPADGGYAKLVYETSPLESQKIQGQAIEQAVETLRNRVDQFGVAEPIIQKVGSNRILLQMPGISDIESVKKVVGSVAKLEFRLVAQGEEEGAVTLKSREAGGSLRVQEQVLMTGAAVESAIEHIVPPDINVDVSFTAEGAREFSDITSEHVGKRLAIVLDGVVQSSPVIREPITGGRASISGRFTPEEAKNLRITLRSGALPAPLKVVEERTVGPTLGRDSIQKGIAAIVAGFIAIILFMVVYYRKSGVIAAGTLALNLVLLLAVLAMFGATLTLPGLAGLALTIGMAVDSNVIIFERIRDELRAGTRREHAVSAGFDKAYNAIIDTNVTGFISGLILYIIGTGPIRGFAVTLMVGIVTTLFCAVFAARLAFDVFKLEGKKGLSI